MKPITEQDRQALIEHCRTMIVATAFPESRIIAEIALASLTANPEMYLNRIEI